VGDAAVRLSRVVSVMVLCLLLGFMSKSGGAEQPPIASLMSPGQYREMVKEREIQARAKLEDGTDNIQKYSFSAAMAVRSSLKHTRRTITDYSLYVKMVPYIDKAEFSPDTRILEIEGGIWKFRLKSSVQFEERGEGRIHYRIVGGHFTGLSGDIFFEGLGERGAAVYLRGEQYGSNWPPAFIIERGAEIVFGFTARRMRSYIESKESAGADAAGTDLGGRKRDVNEVPQPRSRL
jgi:hypothetical protein